jgi:hypothetical protein
VDEQKESEKEGRAHDDKIEVHRLAFNRPSLHRFCALKWEMAVKCEPTLGVRQIF